MPPATGIGGRSRTAAAARSRGTRRPRCRAAAPACASCSCDGWRMPRPLPAAVRRRAGRSGRDPACPACRTRGRGTPATPAAAGSRNDRGARASARSPRCSTRAPAGPASCAGAALSVPGTVRASTMMRVPFDSTRYFDPVTVRAAPRNVMVMHPHHLAVKQNSPPARRCARTARFVPFSLAGARAARSVRPWPWRCRSDRGRAPRVRAQSSIASVDCGVGDAVARRRRIVSSISMRAVA